MSSILDALRKLEEEKAALGEGGVDIARDILRRSARKKSLELFWPVVSLVLLIMVGAILAWRGLPGEVVEINKVAVQPLQAAVVPLIPKPEPKVEIAPLGATDSIAQLPLEPVLASLPFIKLTEIAYQQEAEKRMAIINDLPVMQGTAIEGAEIVEILPEQVVLRWQDKLFVHQIEDLLD